MTRQPSELKGQVLLAALACSKGDTDRTFTFEELLVEAWRNNPIAWGLRGFEHDHPDSERIHRELDSRGKKLKGLVGQGLVERVMPRVYRMTPKGLAAASLMESADPRVREQADRVLAHEIHKILQDDTFRAWLQDSDQPTRFRNAGSFWGVAPGTPAKVIRQRINKVEDTLGSALSLLDQLGVDEIGARKGQVLFDRYDVERCLDFHKTLRQRFAADLLLLGVDPEG